MVYFIRKTYQDEQTKRAFIEILKEKITLPKSYVGMFVLVQWNLKRNTLCVFYESNQQAIIVKELDFLLNPKTRVLGGSLLFVTQPLSTKPLLAMLIAPTPAPRVFRGAHPASLSEGPLWGAAD